MSDILKILNSLTDIASLHYNTELAKSQQISKINQSNAIAERNLQATKERDMMKMTYDSSVRENTELRKRIDDSLKRLKEYNIAVGGMQNLDELLTSVGAGDLISGKMEQHQGDIRAYSTDFKDNKNLQESLNFALEHNNKVIAGLNILESQAMNEVAKIGSGIEALGDDAFDKVRDLSDNIARAENIGKDEAMKKAGAITNDMTSSINRYLKGRASELDNMFNAGEITQEQYNEGKEALKQHVVNDAYPQAVMDATEKYYSPEGFGGKVIASQAPTMKESLDMLNTIALKEAREASWQDTSSAEGKALQEELNVIDRSIRGNIETFGGVTSDQMSDEYKELLKFGNIAGMKPDSKFFTNPKDIKVFKDNIKSNIRNIIDNVSIELDDNTEKALRTAMSGNDGKVRQVVKALLSKDDPFDPKIDVHGLAEDLDLDLRNWKMGKGTTADRTHFAEQLKLWLNLDNKQNKLQGIEVKDTPLPKTHKTPTLFNLLEDQYGINPLSKDAT